MKARHSCGRPLLSAECRKNHQVNVRFTADQIECLKKMAKTTGKPLSAVIRRIILQFVMEQQK